MYTYKYAKEDIPLELFTQKVYCTSLGWNINKLRAPELNILCIGYTHTKDETSEHRLIKITDSTDTRCRLLKM